MSKLEKMAERARELTKDPRPKTWLEKMSDEERREISDFRDYCHDGNLHITAAGAYRMASERFSTMKISSRQFSEWWNNADS